MSDDPQHISQFLDALFSHGSVWIYLVLFCACFIENIFPPFPGDSFIVAAGGLAAVGRLDLPLACAVIIVAGVSSVMVMYFLGRHFGRGYFLERDFKYFSAADIVKVERFMERWGGVILVFSRFIVGLRSVIAVGAGIGRYHAGKMFLYSVISYLLFVGLLMYLSMAVIDNFQAIAAFFSTYHRILWPIVIGLVLVYVVRRSRRCARRE